MTTITIKMDEQGIYKGFYCFGHSGYAKKGQPDILCSAVSTLVINTINCMDELYKEDLSVSTEEENGFINCNFNRPISSSSIVLMDAMIFGLKNISQEYGKKFLLVKFEEV